MTSGYIYQQELGLNRIISFGNSFSCIFRFRVPDELEHPVRINIAQSNTQMNFLNTIISLSFQPIIMLFKLVVIFTYTVALIFSSSNRMFLIPDIYFRGGFISDSRIILFACMKKDCRSSRQPSLDNSYSSCCIVMFLLPLDVVLYISLNHFVCQRENCHIIQLSYNRDAIRNDIKRIYNVENCADDR